MPMFICTLLFKTSKHFCGQSTGTLKEFRYLIMHWRMILLQMFSSQNGEVCSSCSPFMAGNTLSLPLFRWIADADITSHVYHASNVSSMVDYLRNINLSGIIALQQNGVAARSLFRYQPHSEAHSKTVPDVIMQTICAQYGKKFL